MDVWVNNRTTHHSGFMFESTQSKAKEINRMTVDASGKGLRKDVMQYAEGSVLRQKINEDESGRFHSVSSVLIDYRVC